MVFQGGEGRKLQKKTPSGARAQLKENLFSIPLGAENAESPAKAENPLLTRMLSFALDNHDAADKTVRFRLCQVIANQCSFHWHTLWIICQLCTSNFNAWILNEQIVNLCLENLGEEAELDDELYDRLLENLLKRTKDKSPTVRQHACLALHRLQVGDLSRFWVQNIHYGCSKAILLMIGLDVILAPI